jgi:organic radical activating enzyme
MQTNNQTSHFLEFRKDVLDKISPTFCAAKWYESSIFLNTGTLTSCCHCAEHPLELSQVDNPNIPITFFYNTSTKKENRKNLLAGIQDPACSFCWSLENSKKDAISDRLVFSEYYSTEEIIECRDKYGADSDETPLFYPQIVFSNICNLGCIYCNGKNSSVWNTEAKMVGKFQNLSVAATGHYKEYKIAELPTTNLIDNIFWKWINDESAISKVKLLRISGGEPTMSPDFWRLIDWIENKYVSQQQKLPFKFGIITNLGFKTTYNPIIKQGNQLNRLIELSKSIDFMITTSNEATGEISEYIREGLIWENWLSNLKNCLLNGNFISIKVILTLTNLSIFGLIPFLDLILKLKMEIMTPTKLVLGTNKLEWPNFLQVNSGSIPFHGIMEPELRKLRNWIDEKKQALTPELQRDLDLDRLSSLTDFWLASPDNKSSSINEHDFREFIRQFDIRRKKDFRATFAINHNLIEWYEEDTNRKPIKN